MDKTFDIPILYLIFNRPGLTEITFHRIREIKPKQLFVAADGPRLDNEQEAEKCKQVREFVIDNIDWNCDIKTLFREKNLGCGIAVSSAITWFFENVEQGIILEDDCLPDLSFFNYCEELLNYYKDNHKIMHIGGGNFQAINRGKYSYYFSNYNHVWGWASWRRAWKNYNIDMPDFKNFIKEERIKKIFRDKRIQNYWVNTFTYAYEKKIDTWDYQWGYTIWNNGGITIIPNVNLVTNLGFGKEATHTTKDSHVLTLRTTSLMNIIHPKKIKINQKADIYTSFEMFKISREKIKTKLPLLLRIIRKLKSF